MKKEDLDNRQRVLNRYQELYEKDPELRVTKANREGNLNLLRDTFFVKKELDILDISPKEKWNWLHSCNLNSYAPAPLSVMNFYIQQGVPVNAQDMYGMTPLHYAMQARNAEAAIALLNAGADPNIPNRDGLIPLSMIRYMRDRLDVLELMLEKGGNVHYRYKDEESVLARYKPREGETRNIEIYPIMKKYS